MLWSQKFNPHTDLPELSGKIIIVTGANTGIGYATVKQLAQKGAKVYLGSRSEEKGKKAVAQLKEEIGSGEIIWLPCDLASPALAKKSAEGFLEQENQLDVLVNNAACTYDQPRPEYKPAQDGITEMMMVNHIGTFQFTKTLLPLLIKTAEEPNSDVRIITVASHGHRLGRAANPKIRFNNLDEFKNMYAKDTIPTLSRYFVSKLANVLFSNSLQRKLASTNIICIAVHPGAVNTSFTTRLYFPRLMHFIFSILFKSPDEGAYTSCFAAAFPKIREEADKYKGVYLEPVGKLTEPSDLAKKVELQDELWKTTEEYLADLAL